jgi:hypothetical protein
VLRKNAEIENDRIAYAVFREGHEYLPERRAELIAFMSADKEEKALR